MPSIKLSGHTFLYRLTRSRRRSLALKPVSSRSFAVFAPLLTPSAVISRFITTHADWIIKACGTLPKSLKLSSLKQLTILGQTYGLTYISTARDSLIVDQTNFEIIANTASFSNTHLKQLFNAKLRPLALKLITAQLTVYRAQFGFDYGRVSVKNQSTRLGSCSSQGNLSFNWQIIFLPLPLFYHILLHELTHLKIHNHSPVFWRQLTVYDPNTPVNRRLLRSKGTSYFLLKP